MALLTRYVPPGDGRLLDAGVGTGIVGELLAIVGYNAIDGIDISQGMLDKAAEKSLYADLRVADINQPLALGSDSYRAVISSGVFTTGHVGSEGLGQLLAVCEAGGHVVITVKTGVKKDGTILAQDFRAHADGGAYNSTAPTMIALSCFFLAAFFPQG